MKILVFLIFSFLANICSAVNSFSIKYQWKYIEYDWASDKQEQEAIKSGCYNKSASVPVDVDVSPDGRTFITIIRVPGVPATLATVINDTREGGPVVKPYPDWETNVKGCDGLTNVYRIAIDECNQLWVVDSGTINEEKVCPAKLVVYDLSTNTVVKSATIPSSMHEGHLLTPVVHTMNGDCDKSHVYIADPYGALIIYDNNDDDFCRFEADEFKPDPHANLIMVDGESITLNVGVAGMTLSPADPDDPDDNERLLFFKPLTSYNLHSIISSELSNYCNTGKKPKIQTENYIMPSQSVPLAISYDYQLFFGYISNSTIECWSTYDPFKARNIKTIATDDEELQWVSGIKIYPPTGTQFISVLTNRYQKVIMNTINDNEVNYRILEGVVYVQTFGKCG